ncbi:MAG: glycosyltransferase family 39 protein [Candidatus Omnitrophica bacterium]|nr:glycosyltransferase family 39 protein [Candidatus Omnitrophota bacterium]
MNQQKPTDLLQNRISSIFSPASFRDPGLWGILLVQIVMNGFFLSKRTLWVDEAYSAILARRSIAEIHRSLRFDAGPPLYYDLLHIWRYLFGESEWALRSLSLFMAVFTTLGVYLAARRFWNRRAGLFAACFAAFTPLSAAYALEARNYTLFAAFSLAFGVSLIRFIRQGGRRTLIVCALSALALVYVHNMGWFIGLAGGLSALLFLRDRKRWLALLLSGFAVVLFYLPWVPTLLAQMDNTDRTIDWVRNFWSPWAIVNSFSSFIPGGYTLAYLQLPAFPYGMQAVNALLFVIIFLLSAVSTVREKDRCAAMIFVLLSGGLLGPYLYSLWAAPVYLAGRTDYGVFPFLCLIMGFGLSRIHWRHVRSAFLILFLLQASIVNGKFLLHDDPFSERDGILYLQRQAKSGDVILCTGLTRPSFEYALRSKDVVFLSYPRDMEDHLAHLSESWYYKNLDLLQEAEAVLREAAQKTPPDSNLWVIYSRRKINEPLYDLIDGGRLGSAVGSISIPRLGLRKLSEPLFLLRVNPNREK